MTTSISKLARGVRASDPDAVKRVAALWHGGSDYNITGVSHDTEWTTAGLIRELDGLIERFDPSHHEEPQDALAELKALRAWATTTWTISSFDSSYDHRFMTEDEDEVCLTCGAHYQVVHTSVAYPSYGRYRTSTGDDPIRCSHDTDMVHGDRHENGHELDCPGWLRGEEGGCSHCEHECNCLVCRG